MVLTGSVGVGAVSTPLEGDVFVGGGVGDDASAWRTIVFPARSGCTVPATAAALVLIIAAVMIATSSTRRLHDRWTRRPDCLPPSCLVADSMSHTSEPDRIEGFGSEVDDLEERSRPQHVGDPSGST